MLNKERYQKEIYGIACQGTNIALTKSGKLIPCSECYDCDNCIFGYKNSGNDDCTDSIVKWCNSEYKEKKIDWTKVPVDTKIIIYEDGVAKHRHFAKCDEEGDIWYFAEGKTSFTVEHTEGDIWWARSTDVELVEGDKHDEWYKD